LKINNNFKVSIVTVCKNAELTIEGTITSVLSQNYINIEYIIIDGKSTDKTLEIISKYKNSIFKIISINDTGIYDAMNKSIEFINGTWVCFMNSGDYFYSHNTVSTIFNNYPHTNNLKIIYGNFIINNTTIIKKPIEITNIWKRMILCHQTMFVKSEILKENNFDLSYKFASDYDFLYKTIIKYPNDIKYLDLVIAKITTNGFSEINSVQTYQEYKSISLKYNNNFFIFLYHFLMINQRKLIKIIKNNIFNE